MCIRRMLSCWGTVVVGVVYRCTDVPTYRCGPLSGVKRQDRQAPHAVSGFTFWRAKEQTPRLCAPRADPRDAPPSTAVTFAILL
jgi:hypothetical protein